MLSGVKYDHDACVNFLAYFIGKCTQYARGEGMSDYISPDDTWTFNQEQSKCQNFIRGPVFEFYCDLLGASQGTVNTIQTYAMENLGWWQPELEVTNYE